MPRCAAGRSVRTSICRAEFCSATKNATERQPRSHLHLHSPDSAPPLPSLSLVAYISTLDQSASRRSWRNGLAVSEQYDQRCKSGRVQGQPIFAGLLGDQDNTNTATLGSGGIQKSPLSRTKQPKPTHQQKRDRPYGADLQSMAVQLNVRA